jgi:hypothetical protein
MTTVEEALHFMRTFIKRDDMTRSSATHLRRGQKRSLIVAALIAPLLVMLALVATPGAVQASGRGHGISVTPDNGPAGTHVSVTGSGFTGGADVTVGYSSGDCSSGVTVISGATGKAGSDGSVDISFAWPSTQPGDYHVCLTTGGATFPSDNVFHATSADAPSITVTSPVAAGAQVTVTGTNFTMNGAQTVEVLYGAQGSNGCATSAGTASVTNGGFTVTFNAPFVQQTTQYVVTAAIPQGSCASTPTLSAQANLTVNAAPTPTATTFLGTGSGSNSGNGSATGTNSSAQPGTSGLFWPPTWPPSGAWTVVYCLVGLLLLLLILLLLLLFARNRRREEPVTIQERDTVTVQGNGQTNGNAQVQREIYTVDPRTGRQVRIAEEVTSFEEVPPDEQPPAAPQS